MRFPSLASAIGRRAATWARRRQGADQGIATLDSRRVYILPTAVGATFALADFVMLLGSMNYNNSMAFVLTFFLAAIGLVAMHHSHRNLAGTRIRFAGAEPVFVGEDAQFRIAFENPSRSHRYDLFAYIGRRSTPGVDLAPQAMAEVVLRQPAERRGWLVLDRFGVSSFHPFGLFRAWAWLHSNPRCLVWPRPAEDAPPLPRSVDQAGSDSASTSGDEDFAGLRNFRSGDPPKHVAWKSFARTNELKSKHFAGAAVAPAWLSLADLPGAGLEQALAILTRWVLEADAARTTYGLRLGTEEILPASGSQHRHRCLEALALYGYRDADPG